MEKCFNVTGCCNPKLHYMVDITDRLKQIKKLVDQGKYFTINRARQYGKTTTIHALEEYLRDDYIVISMDFQMIGNAEFETEITFARAFAECFLWVVRNKKYPVVGLDEKILDKLEKVANAEEPVMLAGLFKVLCELCDSAEKPIVLLIDEVDSATNNQVFLDFLAQLRGYYLKRNYAPTFQSVILAGVTDVKNLKAKIRPEEVHKVNSPWNIAADFNVDMSFDETDIKGMLAEYEADHGTGMDIERMAHLIYESTSGYPFLVSRLCLLLDERIAGSEHFPDENAAWTEEGYVEAEKMLISEKNTLFDSLTGKLVDYPELKNVLSQILFGGKNIPYIVTNYAVEIAAMYGFIRNDNHVVRIANRIFESVLYNHLLSEEIIDSELYTSGLVDRPQFIQNGHLNMKLVLERFVDAYTEAAQGKDEKFLEEEGRKYFMLYLKPIINGTGHSYVEARTRNLKRTDLVVDYGGEQFVVELKIWRGQKYNEDGEAQIAEYLDYYGLKKGYMITFNFNRQKETGVKEITYGDRVLVEATV